MTGIGDITFDRRRGKRRTVTRLRVRYRSRARIAIGHRVRVQGRLTNPGGQPLDDATIEVFSRPRHGSKPFSADGTARTDRKGRFSYLARASYSRVLRFRYRGSRRISPATREFTMVVPASSSLRTSRGTVGVGQGVLFSGRLRGGRIPPDGKLTLLQVVVQGQWRTFATPRTDRRARWHFRYSFTATSGFVRYRFRLCVPRDGSYPFDTGCSRRVSVAVRGL